MLILRIFINDFCCFWKLLKKLSLVEFLEIHSLVFNKGAKKMFFKETACIFLRHFHLAHFLVFIKAHPFFQKRLPEHIGTEIP